MSRRILTGLRWTFELLFLGLLGVVAAAVIFNSILPALGSQTVILHGGSMSPAYPMGAALLEEKVDPAGVRAGDVITFRGPTGVTVTHRVVGTVETASGPVFETKGDANAAGDPGQVPGQWVSGRVIFGVPLLGFLIAILGIPSGLVLVLSLAAMLLLTASIMEDLLAEGAAPGRRAVGAEGATSGPAGERVGPAEGAVPAYGPLGREVTA
ncbi:MAG: signal peptidase I [Chloroflexota bacterium]